MSQLTREQVAKGLLISRVANEIAVEHSAGLIESYGVAVKSRSGAVLWYELDFSDRFDGDALRRAVRYLALRGMIRRHAQHPNWVKVRYAQ